MLPALGHVLASVQPEAIDTVFADICRCPFQKGLADFVVVLVEIHEHDARIGQPAECKRYQRFHVDLLTHQVCSDCWLPHWILQLGW